MSKHEFGQVARSDGSGNAFLRGVSHHFFLGMSLDDFVPSGGGVPHHCHRQVRN
jgi:hypothetical protein